MISTIRGVVQVDVTDGAAEPVASLTTASTLRNCSAGRRRSVFLIGIILKSSSAGPQLSVLALFPGVSPVMPPHHSFICRSAPKNLHEVADRQFDLPQISPMM